MQTFFELVTQSYVCVGGYEEHDYHFVCSPFFDFPAFRLVNAKSMFLVDQWKKISHSNLVSLREVFTTKSFGDNCESCFFSSSKVLAFLG